jgi:dTDP-4-dehydrorhamnose reductase
MKILVTGARGQLGRALSRCVPAEMECVALGRESCDLSDEASIRSAIRKNRPNIVINSGAYTAVDRAENDVDLATLINGDAVGVIRDELEKINGRLIQVSTDFVFDGAGSQLYRPDDSINPLSVYGRTKAAGETKAGPNATIVRTSWVYAAGGSNFVRTMLHLMKEREEIRVVADQIGAPSWASGLAQTLWKLAYSEVRGVYHHRDAGVASWYDFAVAIQEEAVSLGLLARMVPIIPITTEQYPTPAQRPRFSLLDDSSTRDLLRDTPNHWRVNLRKMLEEEKEIV